MLPTSLPIGKPIVIKISTSAPYIEDHCEVITPEPLV